MIIVKIYTKNIKCEVLKFVSVSWKPLNMKQLESRYKFDMKYPMYYDSQLRGKVYYDRL